MANTMSGLSASSIGNIAGVGSTYAELPLRNIEKKRKIMQKKDETKNAKEATDENEATEESGLL